jgi:hypothetical protein
MLPEVRRLCDRRRPSGIGGIGQVDQQRA